MSGREEHFERTAAARSSLLPDAAVPGPAHPDSPAPHRAAEQKPSHRMSAEPQPTAQPAAEATVLAVAGWRWQVYEDRPVQAVVAWPWSVLLVARAAPMAIMAQPASPARPHMRQMNSPRRECRSRSLCDSHAVRRRRRRIDRLVRAAGIKSLSPLRQRKQPCVPRPYLTSLFIT